jgi:hypothetical protein
MNPVLTGELRRSRKRKGQLAIALRALEYSMILAPQDKRRMNQKIPRRDGSASMLVMVAALLSTPAHARNYHVATNAIIQAARKA